MIDDKSYFSMLSEAYNSISENTDEFNKKVKESIYEIAREFERKKNLVVSAVHLSQDISSLYVRSMGKLHLNDKTKKLYNVSNTIAQRYIGQVGIGTTIGSIFH